MKDLAPPSQRVQAIAYRHGAVGDATRMVPEEVPVALVYDGVTYAVMMASPTDLEDFCTGFTLSEGIVGHARDITALKMEQVEQGVLCQMKLAHAAQERLAARRRSNVGLSGCGLCGIGDLVEATRPLPRVTAELHIEAPRIMQAMREMTRLQTLNRETHGVHAAAFLDAAGGPMILREDVGRHNALDKLIGALARAGVDGRRGAVLLTSRVSIELIQKTAMLGAPVLVAVSVPTAYALQVAEETGITLAAIAREDGFEVFTHPERILFTAKIPEMDIRGASSHVAG
ncbi:MAG: formate dehydrogenase accessory sulfurtransferase FdhD [Acidobacteriaceae bacterium]